MPDAREIPKLTTELIDMSREYLRQETVEPMKRLGRHAGMGFGGAVVLSLGGFFLVLALYALLTVVLPDESWWVVLARFITAVGAFAIAGIVAWRMSSNGD